MVDENSQSMLSRNIALLSICDDEHLRFTRELVLRSEGYRVSSRPSEDLHREHPPGRYDIAILCWTVNRKRRFEIVALLRQANPHIRFLPLDSMEIQTDGEPGLCSGLINSPVALLDAVKGLCQPDSEFADVKDVA